MSEINDGGPAFPSEGEGHGNPLYHSPGMSLRDWFAGQAMVGANASPALLEVITSAEAGAGSHFERLARSCYRQADAMLAERAKTEGR